MIDVLMGEEDGVNIVNRPLTVVERSRQSADADAAVNQKQRIAPLDEESIA